MTDRYRVDVRPRLASPFLVVDTLVADHEGNDTLVRAFTDEEIAIAYARERSRCADTYRMDDDTLTHLYTWARGYFRERDLANAVAVAIVVTLETMHAADVEYYLDQGWSSLYYALDIPRQVARLNASLSPHEGSPMKPTVPHN